MKSRRLKLALAMIVVVDFLVGLTLVQQDIIAHLTINQRHTPPALKTIGVFAVTQVAPNNNQDDVDLWVQDPNGNVSYYGAPQVGLLNLQHDVIPGVTEVWGGRTQGTRCDCEETIIRGVVPGTYTVNEVMYDKLSPGATPVVVTLYRLAGVVTVVQRRIVLREQNQEVTAFRFTVNKAGDITNISYTPKSLTSLMGGP